MSDTIIRVENLGKKYLIGQQQEGKTRYVALRDVIANGVKSFVKNIQSPKLNRNNKQEFWALNNVSFEVKQGEVLGIIGRNGAGKSTLLKILSRITEPTVGRVSLKGRVASLLEVGTGFHPELTGRENIYLNGSILGMAQAEIKRKFDEIVAFAEVEKFLDTPVKRYSSGMYVRLAFAVAAHLEPEILVVDEVLAVGDAAFQKKCLGKMGEVATKEGRTVLFVSHNMGAVQQLTNRSILVHRGNIIQDGNTTDIISLYLSQVEDRQTGLPGQVTWDNLEIAPGNQDLKLIQVNLMNSSGKNQDTFEANQSIVIEIIYQVIREIHGMRIIVSLLTNEGILAFSSTDQDRQPSNLIPGLYRSSCIIPGNLLNIGEYFLNIHIGIPGIRVLMPGRNILSFSINGVLPNGSIFPEKWAGVVCPRLEWQVKQI